jgi:hypothetical protein
MNGDSRLFSAGENLATYTPLTLTSTRLPDAAFSLWGSVEVKGGNKG